MDPSTNERIVRRALLMALALAVTASARSETLRVPADYATIGAAIAAAHNGDGIVVADGVYTGDGNRDLDFGGKRIRLRSENGPKHCIIDCQGSAGEPHRAFHFHSGEPRATTVEGFTIQNGLAMGDGGGILCEGSGPTIRDCVLRWNAVIPVFHQGGGALAARRRSDPRIIDCVFEENVATPAAATGAGAVEVADDSRASFVRCDFVRNSANSGGAVVVALGAFAHFRDCDFSENHADPSGGGGLVIVAESTATLDSCRLVGNSSSELGGGLICSLGSAVRLANCQFVRNSAYGGGGAWIEETSSADVRRCDFSGNVASGLMGGGGGLGVTVRAQAVVDDACFSGNSGHGDGGGLVVGGGSELLLRNSTVVGNQAPPLEGRSFGGAICTWGSRVTVLNSVLRGNTGQFGAGIGIIESMPGFPNAMTLTVAFSLASDSEAELFLFDRDNPDVVIDWDADNFDADPLLIREPNPGPDKQWGTPDDDYGDLHLRPGSPCIDAGDPLYVPRPGETDIDGDPRLLDGDGDGIAVIDIGADEFSWP